MFLSFPRLQHESRGSRADPPLGFGWVSFVFFSPSFPLCLSFFLPLRVDAVPVHWTFTSNFDFLLNPHSVLVVLITPSIPTNQHFNVFLVMSLNIYRLPPNTGQRNQLSYKRLVTKSRATPVQDVPLLLIITLSVLIDLQTFLSLLRSNNFFVCPQAAMPTSCRPMLPPRLSTTRQLPWSTWTRWRTRPTRPWSSLRELTMSSTSKPNVITPISALLVLLSFTE